jgi:hypothetical protein
MRTFLDQFEPGKFLWPVFEGDPVDVLDEEIVRDATDTFGTVFVQGCAWG